MGQGGGADRNILKTLGLKETDELMHYCDASAILSQEYGQNSFNLMKFRKTEMGIAGDSNYPLCV